MSKAFFSVSGAFHLTGWNYWELKSAVSTRWSPTLLGNLCFFFFFCCRRTMQCMLGAGSRLDKSSCARSISRGKKIWIRMYRLGGRAERNTRIWGVTEGLFFFFGSFHTILLIKTLQIHSAARNEEHTGINMSGSRFILLLLLETCVYQNSPNLNRLRKTIVLEEKLEVRLNSTWAEPNRQTINSSCNIKKTQKTKQNEQKKQRNPE